MDLITAEKVSKDCGMWLKKARVEFAMFGEPTLHPKLLEVFSIFRANFPNCQMMLNTNGDRICKNGFLDVPLVETFFSHGLNLLAINAYESDAKKKTCLLESAKDIHFAKVGEYYKGNNYYIYKGPETKELIIVDSIKLHNGEKRTRVITNHAGNVPDSVVKKYGGIIVGSKPLEKICANPFRELTFKYNGNVNLCCMDLQGKYNIGNIHSTDAKEIWFSDRYQVARGRLLKKDRNFSPCNLCNNSGFRTGLEKKWFDAR